MTTKSQNTPPAALQERDEQEEKDKWTIERMVGEVFLNLVRTTEIITIEENGRSISVRKYYRQARELMRWNPVARPSSEFIINICFVCYHYFLFFSIISFNASNSKYFKWFSSSS
ncbi:MAG TPA: hypothetical protein VKA91_01815 [Nitrososphaeraceae archaeon]|nr:hypothetical protein [Nitrososphaeraceae archaeon]